MGKDGFSKAQTGSGKDSNPGKGFSSGEIHCPVEATINLIGGKYKSLILWKLMGGTLRFSQLHKEVPRATPKMLTRQLRELEQDGLLVRVVFPEVPPRVEYSLTEFGKSIGPVLYAMYTWGTVYLRGHGLEANCSMQPLNLMEKASFE